MGLFSTDKVDTLELIDLESLTEEMIEARAAYIQAKYELAGAVYAVDLERARARTDGRIDGKNEQERKDRLTLLEECDPEFQRLLAAVAIHEENLQEVELASFAAEARWKAARDIINHQSALGGR